MRAPFELEADAEEEGCWSGTMVIDRRDVRSRVRLTPLLCRWSALPVEAGADIAKHRHGLIGTGQPLQCHIDEIERLASSPVNWQWLPFQDSPNDWLKAHANTMYFIAATEDPPTVYFNTQTPFSQLKSILTGTVEAGSTAALRRTLVFMLGERILSDLFFRALNAAEQEGGGASFPEGWMGNHLKSFLPALFPEHGNDLDAGLQQAIRMRHEGDGFLALQSKVGTVAQVAAKTSQGFRDAIRSIEA